MKKSYTVTFWKCKECPEFYSCKNSGPVIPDDCPFPENYVLEE